jgi:hypothetical protein
LHLKLDLLFHTRQIFIGFVELRLLLGEGSALSAAVEDVVREKKTEPAEIANEKRTIVRQQTRDSLKIARDQWEILE